MSKITKSLFNKLCITVIVLAMCFTTGMLHNKLVKNYEHSTISKYNVFSKTVSMTQGVTDSSMRDLEHKIRVRIETQYIFTRAIKFLTFGTLDIKPSLRINMTSGGGSVIAGFSVMNLMHKYQKEYNARFLTVADGFCYSMCFAILQQGDLRAATKYTVLGTHPASGGDPRVLRLMEVMMAENVMLKSAYFKLKGFSAWVEFYMFDFYHNPQIAAKYDLIDFEIR